MPMWKDSIEKIFVVNTPDEIGTKRLIALSEEPNTKLVTPFLLYKAIIDKNDGANGLLLTMHRIFEENKGSNTLILEDDFVILRDDFNEIMEAVMNQLDNEFDLLYLGCNLLMPPVKVSENIFKVSAAYSSHSVIYSKKGIDLILKLWKYDKPFDMFLMQEIQPYGKCYCTYPMLISQSKGVSNIFNYDPKVNIGIEKYYDAPTNEIDWGLFMKDQFEFLTKNI